MHVPLLVLGWLLTGQTAPTTEFAPNVGTSRLSPPASRFAPQQETTPMMAPSEEVQLEPIPESSPGVEFAPNPPMERRGGNRLRIGDHEEPSGDLPQEPMVSHTNFAGNRPVAQLLVKHGLTAPTIEAARLPGTPVSLIALVERVPDRGQRLSLIHAYWTLVADVAAANWQAEEVEFTQAISAENGGADRAELESARLDALARWQEARLAVVESQHELARLGRLPVSTDDSLPLPRDLPLVTAYATQFDRIFASRTPTTSLRRLAATIPLQFELIETRAASVSTGRETLKAVRNAYQQRTADLALLLSAQHRLDESQRSFLQAVRKYNESVAAYALEVGGNVDSATMVSMLIPSPTGLRGDAASTTPRMAAVPGGVSNGYSPSRSVRGSIEPAGVRAAGDYSPALPRGGNNWGPAARPIDQ